MSAEDFHRRRCSVTARSRWVQTVLVFRDGRLSLVLPKSPHPRTPAPHAVRRIANTPVFTTTNPDLSSFLRFPPEIRIAIYRLLLRVPCVGYYICFTAQRFVVPHQRCLESSGSRSYRWIRHGIFPAILECCRIINAEGSDVLYGENQFQLGCCAWSGYHIWETANSWPLAKGCCEYMTRMRFDYPNPRDAPLATQLAMFPRLRHLSVSQTLSGNEWEAFCRQCVDAIQRIPKVEFCITVPEIQVRDIYQQARRLHTDRQRVTVDPEAECRQLYLEPSLRLLESKSHPGRSITWRFSDISDDYGPYWDVHLSLEWGDVPSARATSSC